MLTYFELFLKFIAENVNSLSVTPIFDLKDKDTLIIIDLKDKNTLISKLVRNLTLANVSLIY